MKKRKDIEKSLRRYNIPYRKCKEGYLIFGDTDPKDALSEREIYKFIRKAYRHRDENVKANLKETSNSKERARLRENLEKGRFEEAETRSNKEDYWNWD